jgi:hypothetical protein
MHVPLPVRGPGSTGVVLSLRADRTTSPRTVRHFFTAVPCSPVAGHAHATAGYAHLAARTGTRELEGRSSQRTAARRPRSALGPRVPARGTSTAVVAPNMARCTCAGSRADLRHDELGGRLEEGVVVALHCADHRPRRRGTRWDDSVGRHARRCRAGRGARARRKARLKTGDGRRAT